MMKRVFLYFLPLLALCAASCGNAGKPRQAAQVAAPALEIQRLDLALQSGNVTQDLLPAARRFLQIVCQDSASYPASPAVAAFAPLVAQRLGSLDSAQLALGRANAFLRRELPRASFAHVYGVILPYNQSVVLADSMVFVGLNHYLGADCDAYRGFPDFRRREKTLPRLPLDVARAAVLSAYPMEGELPSLLSRMLYEGAVVHALARATGLPPEQVIGYDGEQSRWLSQNEARAWDALLTRRMLYATDPMQVQAMTGPAPATTLLNADAPGQAGRWIGARIVGSYLDKHPDTPISALLAPGFYADATATLAASGYTGHQQP